MLHEIIYCLRVFLTRFSAFRVFLKFVLNPCITVWFYFLQFFSLFLTRTSVAFPFVPIYRAAYSVNNLHFTMCFLKIVFSGSLVPRCGTSPANNNINRRTHFRLVCLDADCTTEFWTLYSFLIIFEPLCSSFGQIKQYQEPPSPIYPWVNFWAYLSIFRTVFTPGEVVYCVVLCCII